MSVVGTVKTYVLERVNTETQETGVLTFAAYNGSFSPVEDIKYATEYLDKDKAVQNAKIQNMLADLNEVPFDYYVVECTKSFVKLDESGNPV